MNFLTGQNLIGNDFKLEYGIIAHKKLGNTEKVSDFQQYGIYKVHHILCEGVTFQPEKKASMAQSVEALTALLICVKVDRTCANK